MDHLWNVNTVYWCRRNIAAQKRKINNGKVEVIPFVVKPSSEFSIIIEYRGKEVIVTYTQSAQLFPCPPEDDLDSWLPSDCSVKTDKTARIHRLIWCFAKHACIPVEYAMSRLQLEYSLQKKNKKKKQKKKNCFTLRKTCDIRYSFSYTSRNLRHARPANTPVVWSESSQRAFWIAKNAKFFSCGQRKSVIKCPGAQANLSLLWPHMSEGTFSHVKAYVFFCVYWNQLGETRRFA